MLKNLYKAKEFSSEFLISKELINTTLDYYRDNVEDYINAFKRIVNNLESREIILPKKFIIALLLNYVFHKRVSNLSESATLNLRTTCAQ